MLGLKNARFALVLLVTSFSACDSGDIPQGELAEVTLVSCTTTDELLKNRIQFWSKELQEPSFRGNSRLSWESSVESMVQQNPGVILHVQVSWSAWISDRREIGVSKGITVGEWREISESRKVFSNEFGTSCESYPLRYTDYFLLTSLVSESIPPEDLAGFLGIDRLVRLPQLFQGYLPRDWRMRRGSR